MKTLYIAACLGLSCIFAAGSSAFAQNTGLELDLDDGADEIELQLRALIKQATGEEVSPEAGEVIIPQAASGEVLAVEGDILPATQEAGPLEETEAAINAAPLSDAVTVTPIIRSEDGGPPVPLLSPSEREAVANVDQESLAIGETVETVVDTTSVTLLEGEALIVDGADKAEGWLERRAGPDFPKWLGVLLALPVFLLSTYLLLRALLSGGRAERFQGRHRLDGVEVGEAASQRTVTRHSMKASRDRSRADRSLGVIRDPNLSKLEHAIKADWRSETAKEPEAKAPIVRKKDQGLTRTTIIRTDLDAEGVEAREQPSAAKEQSGERSETVIKRAPRTDEARKEKAPRAAHSEDYPEERQNEAAPVQEDNYEPLSEADTLAIMERIKKIARSNPKRHH